MFSRKQAGLVITQNKFVNQTYGRVELVHHFNELYKTSLHEKYLLLHTQFVLDKLREQLTEE